MTYKILVLEGIGVKAIASATILERVESILGISLGDYFDLIVGLSSGAIIGGYVAIGYPTSHIKDVYLNNLHKIFPWHRKFLRSQPIKLFHYDSRLLQQGLQLYFGRLTIQDLKHPDFLTFGYDLYTHKTTHFSSIDKRLHWYHQEPLSKILLAANSTPAYFPAVNFYFSPFTLPHIDAGAIMSCPVLAAIAHVLTLKPALTMADLQILSVGTGWLRPHCVDRWGFSDWALSMPNLLPDAARETHGVVLGKFLKDNLNHLRLNFRATSNYGLDDMTAIAPMLKDVRSYITHPRFDEYFMSWISTLN